MYLTQAVREKLLWVMTDKKLMKMLRRVLHQVDEGQKLMNILGKVLHLGDEDQKMMDMQRKVFHQENEGQNMVNILGKVFHHVPLPLSEIVLSPCDKVRGLNINNSIDNLSNVYVIFQKVI